MASFFGNNYAGPGAKRITIRWVVKGGIEKFQFRHRKPRRSHVRDIVRAGIEVVR